MKLYSKFLLGLASKEGDEVNSYALAAKVKVNDQYVFYFGIWDHT